MRSIYQTARSKRPSNAQRFSTSAVLPLQVPGFGRAGTAPRIQVFSARYNPTLTSAFRAALATPASISTSSTSTSTSLSPSSTSSASASQTWRSASIGRRSLHSSGKSHEFGVVGGAPTKTRTGQDQAAHGVAPTTVVDDEPISACAPGLHSGPVINANPDARSTTSGMSSNTPRASFNNANNGNNGVGLAPPGSDGGIMESAKVMMQDDLTTGGSVNPTMSTVVLHSSLDNANGNVVNSAVRTATVGVGAAAAASKRHIELPDDVVAFRDLTLDEILAAKQTKLGKLLTINEEDTVFNAIGIMEKAGIGAVLVRNADKQFTGIFTERDYMRKIALRGLSSKTTSVRSVMTSPPTIVSSSETALHVMQLMTSRRFRHAPVRHDATGEVVGIVSIGDIMASVLKEYKDSASYMRDFIASKYPA